MLFRSLLPYGCDAVVQNSVRWCEVMLFDFGYIEEWLEAFLLLEETSVQRLVYAIPISHPLAIERLPEDWSRIKHLLQMRLGKNYNLE